jgi:acetyl esterase/lipase
MPCIDMLRGMQIGPAPRRTSTLLERLVVIRRAALPHAVSVFCFSLATICISPAHLAAEVKITNGIKVESDIQYIDDKDPAHRLDLYLPANPSDKPLPLIIWIHGGGWSGGSKKGCPAAGMVHRGYAAASIEYRFSQQAIFPAQIQDCQAAIRWLRANSQKFNFDSDHFGVWGSSAGGHLSALVAVTGGKKAFPIVGGNPEQSDAVQAVIDWFGPADFNTVMAQATADTEAKNIYKFNTRNDPYSNLIGVMLGSDTDKANAVSPVHYVSKDNPPILIFHGTLDAQVPFAQSQELYTAMKNAGVDATLQVFPGSGHGAPAFSKPAVTNLMIRFFDKHLKGIDAKIEPLPAAEVSVP